LLWLAGDAFAFVWSVVWMSLGKISLDLRLPLAQWLAPPVLMIDESNTGRTVALQSGPPRIEIRQKHDPNTIRRLRLQRMIYTTPAQS